MSEDRITKLDEITVYAKFPDEEDERVEVKVLYHFDEGDDYDGAVSIHFHIKNRDYSFSEVRMIGVERANQILKDVQALVVSEDFRADGESTTKQ